MINLDHVGFHYGQLNGVIENLIIDVRPDNKVGIIGCSSAENSTRVNLLLRFYDLEKGHITINEQDI